MRIHVPIVFDLFFLSAIASAVPFVDVSSSSPVFLERRMASPDNTCGPTSKGNYTCGSTNSGYCCSGNGYCGTGSDFCAEGCQTAYGTCSGSVTICGPNRGGLSCAAGYCCSSNGYCGKTSDYCDAGCLASYGTCTGTTGSGGAGTGSGGSTETCGVNGGAICSNNQCCSVSGYCGTTSDFCSDPNNCDQYHGRCDSSSTPAGQSTTNAPRPLLGSVTYTEDIYDCTVDKVVALTYDDGPYLYTASLLDLLKTYGFTATFFITGNNNGKGEIDITAPYPSLIQRMIAEGHQVASHTYSHYSLSNLTSDQRIQQMVKNEMALNNIIGKWPTYMRPPYSQCNDACKSDMLKLGYHIVYFDLDTQDYLNPLPTQIQKSKDIVKQALGVTTVTDYLSIQHDIVEQSVSNFSSYYFDLIKQKGWKGVTVGECLGDAKENWYRSLSSSPSIPSTGGTNTATTAVVPTPTQVVPPAPPASTTPASEPSTKLPSPTTAPTTPATPDCASIVNGQCYKIDAFTNQRGCLKAAASCKRQGLQCVARNGLSCLPYQAICAKLDAFCLSCAFLRQCNRESFGF